MQESACGGHFFWDFSGRKWGFSDCSAARTRELLPECVLQGNAAPADTINVVLIAFSDCNRKRYWSAVCRCSGRR